MAQFEYKGAELSSDVDVFDIGKHSYHSTSIALNSLTPSLSPAITLSIPSFNFLSLPIIFLLSFLFPSSTFPLSIFVLSILGALTYVTRSSSITQSETVFDILKFSLAVRLRGYNKEIEWPCLFIYSVSSRPHYQAEF